MASSTARLFKTGRVPGSPSANLADVRIGRIAEAGRAAAEDFRFRQKLDVDFQSDDGLVFRERFPGDGRFLRG